MIDKRALPECASGSCICALPGRTIHSLSHWERVGVRGSPPSTPCRPHPVPLPEGEGMRAQVASQHADGYPCWGVRFLVLWLTGNGRMRPCIVVTMVIWHIQELALMRPLRREYSPAASLWLKELPRRQGEQSLPGVTVDALLEATVSVSWERPIHAARLAFLRRVARPGEVSVHGACGIDRLGFIDVAFGLTTILTDVETASLDILSQQFAELEARLGPLAGRLQYRQLGVEELTAEEGFPSASVHHLTLQNLFNAHLHRPSDYPRLIDPLLTVIAPRGSYFLTVSEATVLLRQAQARRVQLTRMGEIQGYYDENVVLLQVR
jgi:hypothetical protein